MSLSRERRKKGGEDFSRKSASPRQCVCAAAHSSRECLLSSETRSTLHYGSVDSHRTRGQPEIPADTHVIVYSKEERDTSELVPRA
ncbi:hypothetical protein CDAR_31591 [Caerostris darwini]|uniref:Uncharacterized protein n=1 Tax=Caerostris darwini TaxID=1538125 RepID=A0AAV4NU75_9ARAC|nr:hypothetical protein CDAR_31591 [Caerostris darwini]